MNLVLVGLMGSGKSSVGLLLAKALGRPFMDTDVWIEMEAKRSIPALFAAEGEAAFRRREARAIATIAGGDGQVIATGGGAVLDPANREALRRTGLVFWLDAPPAELYQRLTQQDVAGRPLLAGGDLLQRLEQLAQAREAAYRAAAHHRVETTGKAPQAVVQAILAILNQ